MTWRRPAPLTMSVFGCKAKGSMAKRGNDRPAAAGPPAEPDGAGNPRPSFPIHEHIGRTLKALFDGVAAQPIPDRLRKLLGELERTYEQKKTKD